MKINRLIFREYDIRGVVGKDIDNNFAYFLGRAIGTYLQKEQAEKVVVGGDNRESTPAYKENLIQGLIDSGKIVTDIGITTTPVLYFARKTGNFDAAVVVTASHNPPLFNGFKIVIGEKSLYGKQILRLADIMESEDFVSGNGKKEQKDFEPDYISFMKERFSFKKQWRIGLDTGNGIVGPLMSKIFNALKISYHGLYLESDGTFPHHMPDPAVAENLQDLIGIVKKEKLDAGFALDADGDRFAAITEDGKILWGDQLLIIFSKDILKKKSGSKIIFDVKCTKALEDSIKKNGGTPIMWKTGHSLIEDKMYEESSPLAGELSGHLYFADEYFGYDDGTYTALRLLRIMDETGLTLNQLLKDIKQYYSSPEIRIEVADEKKFHIVENLKRFYRDKYPISDIDGVKVYFTDGWALVRASNTQPALVVRVEGYTENSLEKIEPEFIRTVKGFMRWSPKTG
ncbi:MAG: phosphomannomutase/phosphoglucomutase [Candidatus Omnitrophica bacterium]|nr:phosphomannomutase/phosphoglucomutase [Candidatus Omnitrophota bacterium]